MVLETKRQRDRESDKEIWDTTKIMKLSLSLNKQTTKLSEVVWLEYKLSRN